MDRQTLVHRMALVSCHVVAGGRCSCHHCHGSIPPVLGSCPGSVCRCRAVLASGARPWQVWAWYASGGPCPGRKHVNQPGQPLWVGRGLALAKPLPLGLLGQLLPGPQMPGPPLACRPLSVAAWAPVESVTLNPSGKLCQGLTNCLGLALCVRVPLHRHCVAKGCRAALVWPCACEALRGRCVWCHGGNRRLALLAPLNLWAGAHNV